MRSDMRLRGRCRLICNQQVAGSTPVPAFNKTMTYVTAARDSVRKKVAV